VATYSYGGLEIRVTADTREMTVQIRDSATKAGTDAAGHISNAMSTGLKAIGGLGMAVGKSVATGLTAATAAATAFGVESFKTAARAGEMDASLRALAKANNLSYDSMQQQVSSVRKQGIEMGVAQGLVAQFARGQLDLSKATDLAKVAQDAAVISGRNSSEVLDDLVHGIMTQNTQVLRNAGITVNATQAQDAYAKQLGKSRSQLTEAEKSQAVLNAVLNEGKNVAGAYAEAMEEPGKVLRSFKRVTDDIKLSVGQGLVQAFGPLILQTYDLAKGLSAAVAPGGVLAPLFDAIGEAVTRLVAPLVTIVAKWTDWIANLKPEQVEKMVQIIQRFGPALIAAAGGLSLLVAPQLLSGIPVLGGVLTNLTGPLTMVTSGIGKMAGSAVAAIPGISGMSGVAGLLPAAMNPVGLAILGVVAAVGAMLVASSDFREGVIAMGKALWEGLKPALTAVWDALKILGSAVWEIIKALGDALGPALKNLSPLLRQIAELFGVQLSGSVDGAGSAMGGIVPIITGLIRVIGFLLDVTTKVLVPIIEIPLKLLTMGAKAAQVVNPLKLLGQAIEWLTGVAQKLWHWITGNSPGLIPALGDLGSAAMSVAGLLGGAVSAAFSGLAGVVTSAHGAMTSAVSGGWNQMKSVASAGISQMQSAVSSGFSSMVGAARSAGTGMVEGLKSGLSAARGLGGWISSNVTGPVTSMIKGGLGIGSPSSITIYFGQEMVEGLKRGLETAKQHLGWIQANVCGPIINTLKGAFGIGSPSRVTMAMGEDLAEGLELGWSRASHLSVPHLASPLAGNGFAAADGMTGAGGATINVYPQAGQDEREIAALVSRELAWATAGGLG
jgi:phage-related protein